MDMKAVRQIAKVHGVKTAKLNQDELIRTIQNAQGNFDCFGSANDFCDQMDCLWREDCIPET
jgi:hypothetical protein